MCKQIEQKLILIPKLESLTITMQDYPYNLYI